MGISVSSVDLSKLDSNYIDLAFLKLLPFIPKGEKPVSIFSVKNHDEARTQTEQMADNRLEKLARKAMEINDEYSDKYWEIWKLYIPAMRMNGAWDGELVAGKLKQKALNTLAQLKTNSPVDPTNLPSFEKDLNQILDGWFVRTPINGLTEQEIYKLANEVFGLQGSKKQALFTIIPNDSRTNISVYEANIDSSKYNSLPDENGDFAGLKIDSYEIPSVYKKFVQMFINGKEALTPQESQKFMETIKALETIAAFSTKQQEGSANAKKEDVDIFDLSGDGLLNRGNISAMQLFIKFAQNKEIQEKIRNASPEDWNSIKRLKEISGISKDKEAKDLFDLNGDGYVNEKDYELYRKIFSKPNNFDLNGDNFVDNKDIELIEEYFRATLKKAKEDKLYRKNTEEAVGSEEQMRILQNCVQEW